MIELATARITFNTGDRGIAPIYLAARGDTVYGSWELADLHHVISAARIDEREVARLLALWPRYSHHTVFADAHRLTERATAVFDGRSLMLSYPPAALHARARQVREGADVISAYERLLREAIGRHTYDPATTAVELSGGLDSANVATSLADLHPGVITSAAMLLPGLAGEQQRRRRAALRLLSDLGQDMTIAALDHPPLHPGGARVGGEPVSPYEDPYFEASTVMLDVLVERGVRTVFTGIGGDEMVALTSAETTGAHVGPGREPAPWLGSRIRELLPVLDDDIAPASVVNEMTLLACACAAPAMLRAGMWPVHPLADPTLIRFGEQLPRPWRVGKNLHRARLAARGHTPRVTHPALAENFTDVIAHALHHHMPPLLRRVLREGSPLLDRGFLDSRGLTAATDRAESGRATPRDVELYDVLALHLALAAFG
jgi:asparagine synthase (glutamine-hydrolysing)